MNQPPNEFQKFVHRFLMLRPVSAILARCLHHLDFLVLKWSGGRHTLTQIVGLPVIQLTTLGARTGRARTLPLVSLVDGERIALIGSNFGRQHNPAWYHNLKANPKCTVHFNGRTGAYLARQAEAQERERYWQMALAYYRGYDAYKIRASPRVIPVMVLEPLK